MAYRVKGRNGSTRPVSTGRGRSVPRNGIPQNEAKKRVGNYLLGNTVGEGTFGKVKIAVHIPTGEKVAVKILEKKRIQDQADVRRVNREIKILKKARHSNIVQLYEVLDTPNSIYLIMENADAGEMFDYIVANRHVPERQACILFHQLLNGVEELHDNEITHRDLKPENLLLKQSPQGLLVKIVDFGLSNTHDGGRLLATACGSPCYAAPEMIAGQKYRGPMADTWSMGVILFALVCGHLPFEDPNTSNLYRKILSGEYRTPKWISGEVKDLIRKILETDPNKRLTIPEIREHPWCTMVPQSSIPKDDILSAEQAEDTRGEVLKRLAEMNLDIRAVLDAVSSRACNSLSAMYFLLTQKESMRSRLTKKSSSTNSRPETLAQSDLVAGGTHKLKAIEKGVTHILPGAVNASSPQKVVQLPPSNGHHHAPTEPVLFNAMPAPTKTTIPKLNLGKSAQADEGGHFVSQSARQEGNCDLRGSSPNEPPELMSQTARPDMTTVSQSHGPPPSRNPNPEPTPVTTAPSQVQINTDLNSPHGKRIPSAPLRGLASSGPPSAPSSPRGETAHQEDLNVVANGLMNQALSPVEAERPSTRRSKSRAGRPSTATVGSADYECDGPGMGKIPSSEHVNMSPKQGDTNVAAPSGSAPGAPLTIQPHVPKGPQRSGGSASGRRGRHITKSGGAQIENSVKQPTKPSSRGSISSGRPSPYTPMPLVPVDGMNGRTMQPLAIKKGEKDAMDAPGVSALPPAKPAPGKSTAREVATRNKQTALQGNVQLSHDNIAARGKTIGV